MKQSNKVNDSIEIFPAHENNWQGVTITDRAAVQISKLMQQDPQILGLQLNIKKSGCVGFSYVMSVVKTPAADDLLFIQEQAKLYVPLPAMPFLDGIKVDYVREGLNHLFKFTNPKAQNLCGCGESFGI